MVWFYCDDCGDSMKKAKVSGHLGQCSASSFTCMDCTVTFDRYSFHSHTSCVTEKEKYVDLVTKPKGQKAQQGTGTQPKGPVGLEFLSKYPPWKCSLCNIQCSDSNALRQHAQGVKHSRKVRRHSSAGMGDDTANRKDGEKCLQETEQPPKKSVASCPPENGSTAEKASSMKKKKRKLKDRNSTDGNSMKTMSTGVEVKDDEEHGGKTKKQKNGGTNCLTHQSADRSVQNEKKQVRKPVEQQIPGSEMGATMKKDKSEIVKIVKSTLRDSGGSCSMKQLRGVLRNSLGVKKVKKILAQVQEHREFKVEEKRMLLVAD